MSSVTKHSQERNITLHHDKPIKVSIGGSRFSKNWQPQKMRWSEFVTRLAEPIRRPVTVAEFHAMTKDQRDRIKDVGGYTRGPVDGAERKQESIKSVSLLFLDADNAGPGLVDTLKLVYDFAFVAHSTCSHTPDKPRLRIVIPLSRGVSPDEAEATGRKLAEHLGKEHFDPTTFENNRLMYWPAIPRDAEYFFEYQDASFLDPDDYLLQYDDWRDQRAWPRWPEGDRAGHGPEPNNGKAEDPRQKPGIIGAFCRAYSVRDAIFTFLHDVYTPGRSENRFTFIAGSSANGLCIYDDGTRAWSEHATDPAGGKNLTAFDLVRIHKFGELDTDTDPQTPINELPSHRAMIDFAKRDEKVMQELANRQREIEADFGTGVEPEKAEETGTLIVEAPGNPLPTAKLFVKLFYSFDLQRVVS